MAYRVISEHPIRCKDVWRCLISTILVFGIITCCTCGAVSAQTEEIAVSEDNYTTIPRGCQHFISRAKRNDQVSNSSLQTQLPFYRGQYPRQSRMGVSYSHDLQDMVITDSEIGLKLRHLSLALITAPEDPFSALQRSQRRISFFPTSSSATIYKDVYLVSGELVFRTNAPNEGFSKRRREFRSMTVRLEGVFSNRTGHFCSTGCAGASRLSDGDLETLKDQKRNDLLGRFQMTPAKLAYRMEHPESDSFPDSLVDRDCEIHVELEFPRTKTIETSLVTGVMSSLRSPNDPSYFHSLNISGISELPYEYDSSVQNEAQILEKSAIPDISSAARNKLEVWSLDPPFCTMPRSAYEMEFFEMLLYSPIWSPSCLSSDHRHCSPFHNVNISRIVSSDMSIRDIECTSDLKISAAFEFEFTQYTSSPSLKNGYKDTFTTIHVLVAEGLWTGFYRPGQPGQPRGGQAVMVAHYLASDGIPLDTQIEITLQFPIVQSLHHHYSIIGHVRSTREASDALYFPSFSFLGNFFSDTHPEMMYHDSGVKINFDESSAIFYPSYDYDSSIKPKIQPMCNLERSYRNARFPDGSSPIDLEFDVHFPFYIPRMSGSFPSGLEPFSDHSDFSNRFIGQKFNAPPKSFERFDVIEHLSALPPRIGMIPVNFRHKSQKDLIIDMEGYYDSAVGHLCLLGCRRRWEDMAVPYEDEGRWSLNASQTESCDMVFSIQYPPTNPGLEEDLFITGTVTSLLHAGHPLYFKSFFFSSLEPANYVVEAFCSVVWFNFEAIMSLATLSFATFFIAIQVGCGSRGSSFKNLRYLSLAMLAILTSGHWFSFLFNTFNASWSNSLPPIDTVTSSFSGFLVWQEAHTIIMQGIINVALLLEFRLLKIVCRSRSSNKSNGPGSGPIANPLLSTAPSPRTVSDVAVLLTCLPIYATMILVLEFVHWILVRAKGYRYWYSYPQGKTMAALLWADLPAYLDMIVDLFLLPQVIANVLWDTKEKVAPLYPVFYIGMTAVRSTQHLFDAWRQYYTTGSPNRGLYFTEWDFIIIPFIVPCCSVVLATLVLLQQRYGGQCFIPKRLRR